MAPALQWRFKKRKATHAARPAPARRIPPAENQRGFQARPRGACSSRRAAPPSSAPPASSRACPRGWPARGAAGSPPNTACCQAAPPPQTPRARPGARRPHHGNPTLHRPQPPRGNQSGRPGRADRDRRLRRPRGRRRHPHTERHRRIIALVDALRTVLPQLPDPRGCPWPRASPR